jgi:hypothetical protein
MHVNDSGLKTEASLEELGENNDGHRAVSGLATATSPIGHEANRAAPARKRTATMTATGSANLT